MTLQSFDPDAFFTRPASPFAPEQRIHHRRAELFERVVIERLDALLTSDEPLSDTVRDGAALTCAILFGALLDARCWSAWLHAARWPVVDLDPGGAGAAETMATLDAGWRSQTLHRLHAASRLWIDLPIADVGETRRWVADPLTHCLLLRWQRDRGSRSSEPVMPAVAVAAFLRSGREDQDWEEWILSALHQAATIKWRMRMPGFLVEANGERGRCVSLPSRRWMALLGRAVEPISIKRPPSRRPRGKPGTRQTDPIFQRIVEVLPHGRSCAPSSFAHAASLLSDEARRNAITPVDRLVLLWAADRLDPGRDARQRQRRLAPSTIRERAGRLLPILRGAFGEQDPEECDAAGFANACNRYLGSTFGKSRDLAALSCFTAWLHHRVEHLAIAWIGGSKRKESGVSSGLITGREYASLLDRFDPKTANGIMTRLLVILGFRAGLRWSEALNLEINDILHMGRHVELSIGHNRDHRLKSPAGRRVIPLHLLLDDGEIAELLGWWRGRVASTSARLPDGDPDPRNRRRLFPRWTPLLHQSLGDGIVHALKEITGGQEKRFHVLRHSCCSYLLATLALPEDVEDAALVPPIDPALVSHARRRRVAPDLLGHAANGRNVVHAVGGLLGHSGDEATLRAYMHLHDWLTGIYVARPGAQRGLPASMVASLLGMTEGAVERAHRRVAARAEEPVTAQLRGRGRSRAGDAALGPVILSRLLDRPPPRSRAKARTARCGSSPVSKAPPWQVLAAMLAARGKEERLAALHQQELDTPAGQRIVGTLYALLEERTRGRGAIARRRFLEAGDASSERRMRRLSDDEAERLNRLYSGLLALDSRQCRSLCSLFAKGYDRPRGVLRIASDRLDETVAALRSAGCRPDEITVGHGVRTGTIKVGHAGRTDRGFLWAMLFITALQRAGQHTAASTGRLV